MLLRPSPPSSPEVPKAVVCNTKKQNFEIFKTFFFSTPSPPTGQPLSIFGLSTAHSPTEALCVTSLYAIRSQCVVDRTLIRLLRRAPHPPGALVSRRPSAQHFCTVVVNSGSSRNRDKAPPPQPPHAPHSRSSLKDRM